MNDNIRSGEIDLIELFQIIWNGKQVIGIVAATALVLGSAYTFLTARDFTASIILRSLSQTNMPLYSPMTPRLTVTNDNLAVTSNGQVTSGQVTSGQENGSDLVTPNFMTNFIEVLLQRDTIALAAREVGLLDPEDFADDEQYIRATRRLAFDIDISPIEIPSPNERGMELGWQIIWQSDNEAKIEVFIAEVLRLTNEVARQRILQQITIDAERLRNTKERQASRLQIEIENTIEEYQFQLEAQISLLSEQAQLARELGIDVERFSEIRAAPESPATMSTLASFEPFSNVSYKSGYIELDALTSTLSARRQVEVFVPGLSELRSELRLIETDTSIEEYLDEVATSPLAAPDTFRAAQYDLASIKKAYQIKPSLVLTLSLVLGGFIGVVTVLVRDGLQRRARQNDNAV